MPEKKVIPRDKDFHVVTKDGEEHRVPLVTHTREVFAAAKVGNQRTALLEAILSLCPNHQKRRQVCNQVLRACEQVDAKTEEPSA